MTDSHSLTYIIDGRYIPSVCFGLADTSGRVVSAVGYCAAAAASISTVTSDGHWTLVRASNGVVHGDPGGLDERPTVLAKEVAKVLQYRLGLARSALPSIRHNISAITFGFQTATANLAVMALDSAIPESELRSSTLELNRQLHRTDHRPSLRPGEI